MDAYIVEAKRTPIGRAHPDKGMFRSLRADAMLAELLKDFDKNTVSADKISDVYIGCVGQHLEQGKNIARLSSMLAGYPDKVPGVTINRLCASSLQAMIFAAQAVDGDEEGAILAGGVEHMHHVPMGAGIDYNKELQDRYEFPFNNMGLTAEKVADHYSISRQEQDQFALDSHNKALKAQEDGCFDNEILPITVDGTTLSADQGPRKGSNLDSLGGLKTVFKDDGSVTAGNSSQLSDGASLTLVASRKFCDANGLTPKAQIVGSAVVGLNPLSMGLGPIPAIKKLLAKTGLSVNDVDLFELNEAFASQAIACQRELEIPENKINITGGAIALGHPLGCTGTRLVTTLLHNLERTNKKVGVASMCIGHGQGIACLIRRD